MSKIIKFLDEEFFKIKEKIKLTKSNLKNLLDFQQISTVILTDSINSFVDLLNKYNSFFENQGLFNINSEGKANQDLRFIFKKFQSIKINENRNNKNKFSSIIYDSIIDSYDKSIGDFSQLIFKVKESFNSFEQYKLSYYEYLSHIEKIDENISKEKDALVRENLNETKNSLISKSQLIRELLKYEILRYNQSIKEYENTYYKIIKNIEEINQKKNMLITGDGINFVSSLIDFGNIFIDFGEVLNKNLKPKLRDKQIEEKRKTNIFMSTSFNQILSEKTILMNKNNQLIKINEENSDFINKIITNDIKLKNFDENIQLNSSQEESLLFLKKFWESILNQEEIEINYLNTIIKTIMKDKKLTNIFISLLCENSKNEYFILKNLKNMYHLSTIFNTIIISDLKDNNSISILIYIAERTFYYDSKNGIKIFLCAILSKNKIYSSKEFWDNLINNEFSDQFNIEIIKNYSKLLAFCDNSIVYNSEGKIKIKNENEFITKFNYEKLKKRKEINIQNFESNKLIDKVKNIFNKDRSSFALKEYTEKNRIVCKIDKIKKLCQRNSFLQGFINLKRHSSFFDGDEKNQLIIEHNINAILSNPNYIQLQIIENTKLQSLLNITKTFIYHFGNFKYDTKKSLMYIDNMTNRFNMSDTIDSLLKNMILSSSYSIKNKSHQKLKLNLLNENINYFINNLYKKNNDREIKIKIILIGASIPFLDKNSIFNLRILNFSLGDIFGKRLFHTYLNNNLNENHKTLNCDYNNIISKRLEIWKIIMRFEKSKLKYKYKEINSFIIEMKETTPNLFKSLRTENSIKIKSNTNYNLDDSFDSNNSYSSDINSDSEIINNIYKESLDKYNLNNSGQKMNQEIFENLNIIDNDVVRTSYPNEQDKDFCRSQLKNILYAFIISKNKCLYSQGMNYIVSFFQYLTNYNEEETFYLFMSFIDHTEYSEIFDENIDKIKKIFYIFDRLISLYCPEINSLFYHNNIGSSYYSFSWFAILFTNNYLENAGSLSLIFFKIWDEFLINGWNSIIKVCVIFLRMKESTILKLKDDNITSYLFNEILKTDIFENKNFNILNEDINDFNLNQELIDLLSNEFKLSKDIEEKSKVLNMI